MARRNRSREAELERPIIIIGTGRCGSTLLQGVLALHPNLAWLSQLTERYPGVPRLNRLAMIALDTPLLSRLAARALEPIEPYAFWDAYCPGFSRPIRDLVASDVLPDRKNKLRAAVAAMLTGRRNRVLLKITGWPRVGYLKELFPDAKFVHVYRDGRAVASSLLRVPWWDGWRGPGSWRWGGLSPAQETAWERHGRSFVALAALEWEILMDAQNQARAMLPTEDLMDVRYEDLCARPTEVIRRVTEFAGLPWAPEFAAAVARVTFRNSNNKWGEQLTSGQQRVMTECLGEALTRYGYG